MKKHLFLLKLVSFIAIFMAFAIISIANKSAKHKIKSAHKVEALKKQTCSCGTAINLKGSHSGGYATLQWTSVSGAFTYSVGGYFSCNGAPFSYCVQPSYGTTSVTIPIPLCGGGGTFRVTTNCNGTTCTTATCSSNPSAPQIF